MFVSNVDGGDGGREYRAVGMGKQENGFFDVIDVGYREAGMVFCEVNDGIFAGNVGGGDYGELVPRYDRVEFYRGNAAPGDRAADGCTEPHTRKRDIVDVPRTTENLVFTFFALGRFADDLGSCGHWDSVKNRTKLAVRAKY